MFHWTEHSLSAPLGLWFALLYYLVPQRLTLKDCIHGLPCLPPLIRLRYWEAPTTDSKPGKKWGGHFPSNSLPAGHKLKGTAGQAKGWTLGRWPICELQLQLPGLQSKLLPQAPSGLGVMLAFQCCQSWGFITCWFPLNLPTPLQIVPSLNSNSISVCHLLPTRILTDMSTSH